MYIQYILNTIHMYIQYIFKCNIYLYTMHMYMQYISIYNKYLYSIHIYIHCIFKCNTHLYTIHIYMQYIFIYHHHHHVVPPARISLTLSRHFSLSFISFGRSSGLHHVSSHRCCMYVRAGRPALAWPYAGVHRSKSLMSSSLLLQQCSACLVRLTFIVFVMGGKWPYSWCLLGCYRQDLFNIPLNILVDI